MSIANAVQSARQFVAALVALVSIRPAGGFTPDQLLRIAASLDQASKYIIAQTIVAKARGRGMTLAIPSEVVETPQASSAGSTAAR